ncbi:MAG: HD domain-containing protein [Bacillota bacterium]
MKIVHIACDIASHMNLKEKTIQRIHIGGHLHDIGKISISDQILN